MLAARILRRGVSAARTSQSQKKTKRQTINKELFKAAPFSHVQLSLFHTQGTRLRAADPKEKDYSAFADELLKYAEQPFAPAKPKPQPSGPLTRGARAAATPPAAEKPATSLPADLEKIKQLTEQLEKLKAEHAKALEAKDARQKELEAKVNDLTAANTEAKERLVASIADKDNLVKIGRRDVENAREFGVKGLVVKLFDVVDTLNICLANLPESAVVDNPTASMAREAIESIKIQFMKILIDYGVEENIPSVGDKFDPTAHNALFEMQPTKPGDMVHTIGSVFKNGWTRKGALIRAAQVGVFNRSFEDNAAGDATPKSAPSQQEPTPEAPNL